jgi:hypothetical protein
VRGVDALHVVDASVMPTVVGAATKHGLDRHRRVAAELLWQARGVTVCEDWDVARYGAARAFAFEYRIRKPTLYPLSYGG